MHKQMSRASLKRISRGRAARGTRSLLGLTWSEYIDLFGSFPSIISKRDFGLVLAESPTGGSNTRPILFKSKLIEKPIQFRTRKVSGVSIARTRTSFSKRDLIFVVLAWAWLLSALSGCHSTSTFCWTPWGGRYVANVRLLSGSRNSRRPNSICRSRSDTALPADVEFSPASLRLHAL
jgi:hypothetical protein